MAASSTNGEHVTVAGQEVKSSSVPLPTEIDLKDRDPYKMNQHLRLVFSDIIGEPEPGTFSFDKVWTLSFQLFTATKLWCYRILSLICAIPCAICWGICFACLSFCNIWMYVPCIKSCKIELYCFQQIFDLLMGTIVAPIFDAFGRCFSNIRVTMSKDQSASYREKMDSIHLA